MSELATIDATTDVVDTEVDKGPMAYLAALEEAGAATDVALRLGPMSYHRWEMVGKLLGAIDQRGRWYIGDWLNHGEALFGEESAQGVEATTSERYSEAERITGLDHGTLMNIRSICGKIAADRRRVGVPLSTHAEVAKLDPDEQVMWLQRTVENGWTRSELRQAIRDAKNPPSETDEFDDAAPPVEHLSISERIEAAARAVWQAASNNSEGDWVVPASAMAQLRAALGEE